MRNQQLNNLAMLIDANASARPTHPAIICDEEVISYRDLATRIVGYSVSLTEAGVKKGDMVGVRLKDRPEHLLTLFALMRLGAIFVPMDVRWTHVEASTLVTHFRIGTVLTEPGLTAFDGAHSIEIDPEWNERAVRQSGSIEPVDEPDLAMLLSLSSGTSGRPTGPILTHGQMRARMENQLAALTFNQHDRYMLATPLYFGGGRAFALTNLMIGATLVLFPPPYTPQQLVEAVSRYGVTSTFLVPTLIRRLLELPDNDLAGLAGLRLLVSSGSPLHPPERAQIAQRLCRGFFEYYASTEGGGVTILAPQDQQDHPDSVGRAAFRVEVEVVDDTHRTIPAGEVGSIRYRGPGVAENFFNDPQKSVEAFHDGWFYPGDLGSIDKDGFLTLMGRSKNVIIRGGVNIYPIEIERHLESHPDVTEAVVLGIEDESMGEKVLAVLAVAKPVTPEALDAFCRSSLTGYKIPERWFFLDALPRNSGGKVVVAEVRKTIAGDHVLT